MDASFKEEQTITTTEKLFVLGAPRSGTTFLSSLLRETRFGEPIESHFITKYGAKLAQYGDISDFSNFRRLIRDVFAERPVQQWQLDFQPREIFERMGPPRSYPALVDTLMLMREGREGKTAWGDKTPHYLGNVGQLVELFPDAQFIYIVRDGRDVALSLLEKPWGPANVIQCAEYWVRLNHPSSVIQRLEQQGQVFFLTYESLLDFPEEMIRRLYRFLNEPLTEKDVRRLAAEAKSNSKFRWRRRMHARQIRQFEAIAGPTLKRFGYDLASQGAQVSPIERMLSRLHGFYARWRFLFKTNVIDGIKIRFFGKQPFNE
ncbi:hypothetical protein CF392_02550 [Tamilnaduibacter salinus]|uniref:Sulfotransferase family protein n=1 Tax=Tamilnaduibacter salinus TaxID=1484056 RepID=A0A2A2I6W0_9GAMM|nr:sulfotransferase [Tamilnaduibacter salinus]PAV27036.1 hypothetical protein CF392_02550 [Tamilnaduibacter salinus]